MTPTWLDGNNLITDGDVPFQMKVFGDNIGETKLEKMPDSSPHDSNVAVTLPLLHRLT